MTSSNVILLSKKGMKELKRAIAKLEHKRQDIISALREGDKTDGRDQRFDRVERLAQLEIIESDLADKQLILRHARLFPRKRDAIKVAIGSVVELIDTHGKIMRYTIVDSIEANPSDGRISMNSPLGMSLLGKRIKETVEWGSGVRKKQMQLIAIK